MYFHTNIDCAKRLLRIYNEIANNCVAPHYFIGDRVVIYQDPDTELEMKVVSRKWVLSTTVIGREPTITLQFELGLGHQFQTITDMEKFMKSRGLPIH